MLKYSYLVCSALVINYQIYLRQFVTGYSARTNKQTHTHERERERERERESKRNVLRRRRPVLSNILALHLHKLLHSSLFKKIAGSADAVLADYSRHRQICNQS